jgi:hypothetical protein
VPPLSHPTSCTTAKYNLYLAHSLVAAVSEPALYRLLTFQVPNPIPLFRCLYRILHLKCDGTRAETRFRLSTKRTSPFKSTGASVQSTTGRRAVHIILQGLYCSCKPVFYSHVTLTGYPLHSLVSPSLLLPVRHRMPSHFKGSLPKHQSRYEALLVNISKQAMLLLWAVVNTSSNHQAGGTTPCLLSVTVYSIYSQLPSISEAVPSSATWGRAMLWWQGPTYHVVQNRAVLFYFSTEWSAGRGDPWIIITSSRYCLCLSPLPFDLYGTVPIDFT